jgi:hypothetical protein
MRGDPGSGRYPAMMSILDCRCLDIGELADRGRTRRIHPAGPHPLGRYPVLAHLQANGPGRDGVANRRRVSGPFATRLLSVDGSDLP